MKIVNEKGKLFGIINVVDLVILLAVVVVVGAIIWQVFGNRVTDAVSKQEEVTIVVSIAGSHPDLVEEVLRQDLVGEQIVSGNEYVNAYITNVWLEDYVMQIPTADGTIVDATDPTQKTIYIEIKSQVAAGTASPSICSQELRAGRTYIVKTQTFECSGIIYYVQIGDEAE